MLNSAGRRLTHLQKITVITFYVILPALLSVEGTPEPGRTVWQRPQGCAGTKALEIAAELGLDTHNAEGYIGWAQTGPIADGQKIWLPSPTPTLCPRATAGMLTPTPCACGDWPAAAAWPTTKAPAFCCLYALKY